MPKEKIDEMAATLFAISVVTRKLAREVLKDSMKGVEDVKDKDAKRNQRRSRKSCNKHW